MLELCCEIVTIESMMYDAIFDNNESLYDFWWDLGSFSNSRSYSGIMCVAEPCPKFSARCVGEIGRHSYSLYAPGFPDVLRFYCEDARMMFQRYNPVYAGWLHFEENTRCDRSWQEDCQSE